MFLSETSYQYGYFMYMDGSNIILVIGSSSLKYYTHSMVVGQWYHLVIVRQGTSIEIFQNNTSLGTQTGFGTTVNTKFDTFGGKTTGGYAFNGLIDGMSAFNYALSSSQITTLYGSSSTGIGNPMSLSPKPVAYYPLGDQDAFNGADYLVPNSSLKDYVFDFNSASSDNIDCGNNSSFDITSALTLSAWVKLSSATTNQFYISKRGSGNAYQISSFSNKAAGMSIWIGGSRKDLIGTTNHVQDVWYHVVGTYDGSNMRIYLNGVEENSVPQTGAIDTTTAKLILGAYDGSGYSFDGEISNAAIFNTALSATDVETLYNNGSPLTSMSGFTSLVGWWKLDASDTYDSSTGNFTIEDHAGSNDGTSSGMTQANLVQSDLSFTNGYSPYALEFDGTNDYIDCGTGSRFNIDQITISAWVNLSSGLTSTQIIAGIRNNTLGGSVITYQLQNQASGKFRFVICQSNGTYVDTVADSVHQYNTWYHVAGVADGSNIKLYINGNLQTIVSSYDGTIYSPNENFNIGKQSSPAAYYWNGKLSNVSVWNAGLTSTQVSELYNEGVPSNLNNHSAYSNLVSWWQLGSNSSFNTNWTVLDEVTASGNNGTSSNMGEDAIVDGVGSYANGLSSGMGGDEVIGDAPFSDANSLSINMDVLDRVEDTPA